jgi:hypothetical protein
MTCAKSPADSRINPNIPDAASQINTTADAVR